MNPDPGRFIEVNGVSLYVEEHGAGVPVLLMHGFPDSARLWRNQVPVLVSNDFRVITPDMRGFGRSGRPQEVAAYRLANVVADVTGLLDLSSWPVGMRVIVRKERPHPGAQLRFTDADGMRLTCFATNTASTPIAHLELRHRQREPAHPHKSPPRTSGKGPSAS